MGRVDARSSALPSPIEAEAMRIDVLPDTHGDPHARGGPLARTGFGRASRPEAAPPVRTGRMPAAPA